MHLSASPVQRPFPVQFRSGEHVRMQVPPKLLFEQTVQFTPDLLSKHLHPPSFAEQRPYPEHADSRHVMLQKSPY